MWLTKAVEGWVGWMRGRGGEVREGEIERDGRKRLYSHPSVGRCKVKNTQRDKMSDWRGV